MISEVKRSIRAENNKLKEEVERLKRKVEELTESEKNV